jgi:hypothetical protein
LRSEFFLAAVLSVWVSGASAAALEESQAPGMYRSYTEPGVVTFDRYLGDPRAIPMEQLVPALLFAIDQLSKYPRPGGGPEVHRVARAVIEDMVCAGKCAVRASYRPGEGIYLDQTLQPETNLFDRSVLLHELVHYVQDLANERGDMEPCKRWYYREIEAYAIQKQFLMLIGSPIRVAYSANKSPCDESIESRATKKLNDDTR